MDQTCWIHDALVYDNGFPVPYFSVRPFSSPVADRPGATISCSSPSPPSRGGVPRATDRAMSRAVGYARRYAARSAG